MVALSTGNCNIKNLGPAAAGQAGVAVVCGGASPTPVRWSADKILFSFAAPAGVNCTVASQHHSQWWALVLC